jgi:hypothetical protein
MDYLSLCRNEHERNALIKLDKVAKSPYAQMHQPYRQAAEYALDVFKDMLLNREMNKEGR